MPHFSRLDSFRVAASDIGLVTNVFLEMYNSGQESKKWFLDEVMYAHDKKLGKCASVYVPLAIACYNYVYKCVYE